MLRYIAKRLFQMIFVLIGVSFMIYFTMDMAPGDLATTILGDEAPQENIEALQEELGLNRPLIVRYLDYIWGLLHGEMGYSYKYNTPAWELFSARVGLTVRLSIMAICFAIIISIPFGILSALKRGTLVDNALNTFSLLGLATPNFWVGLMLIILFSLKLGWFNSGGYASMKDLVLPMITCGLDHMASYTRTTRSSMIDTMRQDYLLLARAKGVSERKVTTKHALKNALIPIITIVGMSFSGCVAGATITETVFNLQGVGRLTIDAVRSQDVEVVCGNIIMISLFSSVVLLLIDIIYAFVDPRIKAKYSKK